MDYRKQLDEALAIAKDTKSFEFGNDVLGLAPELFRKNFGEKAALVVADNNTTDVPINLVAVCTHQQGEALVGGRLLAQQRYYLVVDVFVGHFVIVVSDY